MSCVTVKRYHIIQTMQGTICLESLVRDAIAEGWQPLGAPFFYRDLTGTWAQAMTNTKGDQE